MSYFLIGLLVYWALSVALAFRKGIFVSQLREAVPQLFILPPWMRACILFLVFIIAAPMAFKEPILYIREWWMNRKLGKVARGIRKMSKDKSLNGNPEFAADLKKIADGLDELSKM